MVRHSFVCFLGLVTTHTDNGVGGGGVDFCWYHILFFNPCIFASRLSSDTFR